MLYFANDNIEPFEREMIDRLGIAEVRLAEVAADPHGAAAMADGGQAWARRRSMRLLIHLDVDVLDFADMPLAVEQPLAATSVSGSNS